MKIDQAASRRRLLVLTSTFPRWKDDAEPAFVFELCRRLAGNFDVMVLAPHAKGAALRECLAGIEIRRFPYFFPRWEKLAYEGGIVANLRKRRWNYLIAPLFIAAEFIAALYLSKRYRIDAIHAHWIIPQGTLAVAVRKVLGEQPALACTLHGSDLFALKGALFNRIKRWTAGGIDHLTVVSHAMREPVAALGSTAPISVIPMGVDLRQRFTPPPSTISRKPFELLCVGRLVPGKGIHHVIEALPRILNKYPAARLVIVGEGPERPRLAALASRLGLDACIEFAGALNHASLAEHYRRASLLVSASLQEGFGLVLVEAMGCECPVLVADLPAVRDIVKDGVTGTLCQQESSADLAEKAIFLLEHADAAARIARAARQHVLERFDWDSIAERYRDTIESMCQRVA